MRPGRRTLGPGFGICRNGPALATKYMRREVEGTLPRTRFTELLGCSVPFQPAPIGGASPRPTAAVADAPVRERRDYCRCETPARTLPS